MKKVLVYDFPTRFFHWTIAGLFVSAYFIAQVFDDDSSLYPYHMMLGFTLASAVVLRVFWGLIGSKYARFSSFALNPRLLAEYLRDVLTAKTKIFTGHNPASSWAAIAMMSFSLGLAFTGFQMAQGNNKEFYEDIHELLANGFMIVAVTHVAGVIFHTLRHRDPIALSMVSGTKSVREGSLPAGSSHLFSGLVFLIAVGFVATSLFRSYDPAQRSFSVFGTTLQVGEHDHEEHGDHAEGLTHDDDND